MLLLNSKIILFVRFFTVEVEEPEPENEDVNLNNTEEIFLKALIESPRHEIQKVNKYLQGNLV